MFYIKLLFWDKIRYKFIKYDLERIQTRYVGLVTNILAFSPTFLLLSFFSKF